MSVTCRRCTMCEGMDHHWDYFGDEDEAGDPVWSCKHCDAIKPMSADDSAPLPHPMISPEALDLEGELDQIRLHPDQLISGHIVLRLIQAARGSGDELLKGLRIALVMCAERFREYEALHAAKPDHEKAVRNAAMALMCETVLRLSSVPSPTQNGEGGGS